MGGKKNKKGNIEFLYNLNIFDLCVLAVEENVT